VSTINSYAWYLQAIPSKFSCATFQIIFKILLILWHFFSSWGRSGRICYLSYYFIPKRKKKKKKKRKKALLHVMWMLVGTRWNRLAMVCERKKVGRSAKLYKRAQKCQLLSQKLAYFCMEDSKNPIASRWQRQPPLKTKFLFLCYTNEKL
jgi:hypothetical protein